MEELSLDDDDVRDNFRDDEAKMCSAVAQIPGCQCTRTGCSPSYQINCSGDLVTQETIESLMRILREVIGKSDGWLKIKTLYIIQTKLVELNLTPLAKVRFDYLSISNNDLLSSIKGRPLDEITNEEDLIHARSLHISFNPLMTDEGFGNTLKYFSPSVLYDLNLWGMKLQGSLGSDLQRNDDTEVAEFLPGLSLFEGLQGLELAMNEISRIGGGQFKKNNKLSFLNLRKNEIKEIWRDAFSFDEIPANDDFFSREYHTLVIGLDECSLTVDSFVDGQLDWTQQRAIHLDMWTNQFVTLPASVFEHFLNVHQMNEIIVSDNPLVRDDRLKWLIDQKEKFQDRVHLTGPNTNGFNFEL